MASAEPVTLDVVSDVVCPWCFVGKRRIERAGKIIGRDIQIRWFPFELDPRIPTEGLPREAYRVRKFGSLERSRMLEQQLSAVGQQVGIEFRFERMQRTPNTRRAHVLLKLAAAQDLQTQNRTAERLFTAYFLNGEDPGEPQVLLSIAREMGIDSISDPSVFDDPTLQGAILKEEDENFTKGVQAVPSIFYRGKLIASGAQPEQILANAILSFPES